ncbi:MAG: methyltransferase [Planctomycetes bacterium]|nr:methyltransferase [Planctomycetota bacterium]
MSNPFLFLSEFIKSPVDVAAVTPSSRALGREMLRDLDLRRGDLVVEYGPGTGSFTRLLAPLVEREGIRYLGIERNEAFHRRLTARFPGLRFALGSAEHVAAHLASRGLPAPRAIVSGLPLAAMPRRLKHLIVDETARTLADGGSFRQFSYWHFYPTAAARELRDRMRERFARFALSRPVLWNLPPALVYRGQR